MTRLERNDISAHHWQLTLTCCVTVLFRRAADVKSGARFPLDLSQCIKFIYCNNETGERNVFISSPPQPSREEEQCKQNKEQFKSSEWRRNTMTAVQVQLMYMSYYGEDTT